MPYRLIAAGVTDIGQKRKKNEDCFVANANIGIFGIADGMGALTDSEQASRIAIEESGAYLMNDTFDDIRMNGCFRVVHRAIVAFNHENNTFSGTTLTLFWVDGQSLQADQPMALLGHAGDSRCYQALLVGEAGTQKHLLVDQLTEDNTVAMDLVRSGNLKLEEVPTNRYRNVLTRCLGGRLNEAEQATPSVASIPLEEDMIFLLCSDGFSDLVDIQDEEDEEARALLLSVFAAKDPLQLECVAGAFVALANERGGYDNITVVLVKVLKD